VSWKCFAAAEHHHPKNCFAERGMAMKKLRHFLHDQQPQPQWYWSAGLHDACIYGVETFEFPFDYGKFEREKFSYDRNLFLMRIDAEGAIYDCAVREIRLFNYKILSKDISLDNRKKIFWLSDRLTGQDGNYILEIDLEDFDGDPVDFTFKIQFERAEVIRQ
jgi:hypothetical protein